MLRSPVGAPGHTLLLLLLALSVACGPVHQAIQPSPEDVRALKRVAVFIPKDGEFAIFFDRATATATPAILFGLVGAAIASAHNQSRDTEKMTALNPHLTGFSPRATFAEAFSRTLKNYNRQSDFQLFDGSQGEKDLKNIDAIVTFNIKTWGLRLANQTDDRLAAFVEIETTLVRSNDSKTLWNMHDTFLGQKRAYFSDFKENGPVLRDELRETVGNAGTRMATKMIYPRGSN